MDTTLQAHGRSRRRRRLGRARPIDLIQTWRKAPVGNVDPGVIEDRWRSARKCKPGVEMEPCNNTHDDALTGSIEYTASKRSQSIQARTAKMDCGGRIHGFINSGTIATDPLTSLCLLYTYTPYRSVYCTSVIPGIASIRPLPHRPHSPPRWLRRPPATIHSPSSPAATQRTRLALDRSTSTDLPAP